MIIWPIVCSIVGAINATPDNFISIGYGACYHYDSFNYSMHYEHIQVQGVVMTPARWRTTRMQPEQYVLVQYYNEGKKVSYYIGLGYNIGNRVVYSGGVKYSLNKYLSASAILYQSYMNHVVIGLNLEL